MLALKKVLETLGIPKVTSELNNYSKARAFIILLSSGTRNDPTLVNAVYKTAGITAQMTSTLCLSLFFLVSSKPIFNIGLAGWFDIFDESKWADKTSLRNLRDALARLNQVI